MAVLTAQDMEILRSTLQDAVVKCSERCLYQSAKWSASMEPNVNNRSILIKFLYRIAELLTSLPSSSEFTPASDMEDDSQMSDSVDHPRYPQPAVVPVV